ncbi:MAG: hypothetical protein ABJK25_08890 [Halieaceae bacterium]
MSAHKPGSDSIALKDHNSIHQILVNTREIETLFAVIMSSYIRQGVFTFFLLTAVIAIFNMWADPYNIYRFQTADSMRMSRVDQGMSMRLSKPWQVMQRKPGVAIVGSSRSGSIDAEQLHSGTEAAFNLSMPGLTPQEMLYAVEHALLVGDLTKLVIMLDYETLISSDYKVGIGFEKGRLAPHDTLAFYRQALADAFNTLFTTSVLTHSALALSSKKISPTLYYPDGSWTNSSRMWRGESGYVSVGKNLIRLSGSTSDAYRENIRALASILAVCYGSEIDTTLIISPEHIFLTDLRETISASTRWYKFHEDIARLNKEVADDYEEKPFTLFGFNHIRGVVDEPLPSGDVSPQAWFRDGIHFRKKLGNLMMEQIRRPSSDGAYLITTSSVEKYLAQVEAVRKDFTAVNGKEILRYKRKIL